MLGPVFFTQSTKFEAMSKLVVKHFSQIQVSNVGHVNNENVEEYVTKLLEQTQEDPQLKEIVKAIG